MVAPAHDEATGTAGRYRIPVSTSRSSTWDEPSTTVTSAGIAAGNDAVSVTAVTT